MAHEDSVRISLEDIIAAAGQGAVRALNARQQGASNPGFYIDLHIRVGLPGISRQAIEAVEEQRELGPLPDGGSNKG